MTQVMITNGGPHPASKWAEVTANRIAELIDIAPNSTNARALREKEKFRLDLVDLFEDYHAKQQNGERKKLKTHGFDHLPAEIEVETDVEDVLTDLGQLVKGTSFEAHFKKPEVVEYVTTSVAVDLRTTVVIERDWHAAKDREHPKSKEFEAKFK